MIPSSRVLPFGILVAACCQAVGAHSGPPYPIVSERAVGGYVISVWTDPDTTDDGSAGGQFWVVLEAAAGKELPAATQVEVTIQALARNSAPLSTRAAPVKGAVGNQFAALVMDHEGPFSVNVTVSGPFGPAGLEGRVDATYDLRPSRGTVALYLLPFVAVGVLWVKALLRRRQAGAQR